MEQDRGDIWQGTWQDGVQNKENMKRFDLMRQEAQFGAYGEDESRCQPPNSGVHGKLSLNQCTCVFLSL